MGKKTSNALLLAICFCLVISPVRAFEIFGFKFFERSEPESVELIDPLSYSASLVLSGDDVDLENAINRGSALLRGQDQPAPGRAGLLSRANADYTRLIDTLYARGYFGATVSITLNGGEAARLPLDVSLPDPTEVRIIVNPGDKYRFGLTEIVNARPNSQAMSEEFSTGQPALSVAVRDAGRKAVREWQDTGFAKANIPSAEVVADHNLRQLDARLTIETGPKTTYGPLKITGTNRVDHDYLAYMVNLPEGATYNRTEVEKAQKRLLKLDAFGVVEVTEAEDLGPNDTVPLTLTVQDRKPRRLGFGATISTLDGAGLEGFWLHRNIFSRAERLRFDGSIKGIGRSLDPTDYDYKLGATLIKPGAFTPDTDFRLGIELAQEKLDNYDSLALSVTAGVSSIITERLNGELDFVLERSRIDDSLGRRQFTLIGLDGGLTYERRDVPVDAKSGYFLDLQAFPFYENKGGKFGLRTSAEARAYATLDDAGKFVLAGRAKIGAVHGLTITQAPPQVLFFSGGGGSVRGFEYLSNGVTLPNGQELGGRSVIELSAEIRTAITENFGVVGFIDGGLVGPNSTPDFNQPFKVGVGVGLRWRTGLGPLRIDIARALNRQKTDPQVGVYIGIGQAF